MLNVILRKLTGLRYLVTPFLHPVRHAPYSRPRLQVSPQTSATSIHNFILSASKISCPDFLKQNRKMGQEDGKNVKDLSSQALCKKISDIIKGATEHEYLFYEDINPEIGFTVANSLDEDGEVENIAHR